MPFPKDCKKCGKRFQPHGRTNHLCLKYRDEIQKRIHTKPKTFKTPKGKTIKIK